MEKLSFRKGEVTDMRPSGNGRTRLTFLVPSRGLIGYQGEFLTDSRGTGIINRLFHSYGPHKGPISGRRNGILISTDKGEAVAYTIFDLQDRGIMFIKPQDKVYCGMIVGQHSCDNDLEINVFKGSKFELRIFLMQITCTFIPQSALIRSCIKDIAAFRL
jgi:GTP-binding protein